MSERCLDRKSAAEALLPAGPAAPAADERRDETPDPFLFPAAALQLGPKSEQRRREALWDLFQSECAFLYDHLMVLKNVSRKRVPADCDCVVRYVIVRRFATRCTWTR